jgi:drug/metabolite transporter (DMT)-like permease
VLYGLVAALGWGTADFGGTVAGRRIGSIPTVVVAQGLSALILTVAFVALGHVWGDVAPIAGWMVLNGVFSATAYAAHYHALKLGPMALVSPISAAYAVVGVALSMVILDERPGAVALVGAAVTVVGVMLASTDLKKVRAGTHGVPPGLPWALVAALCFGIGGFILGWGSKQVGWVPALWASRTAQLVCFATLAAVQPRDLRHLGNNRGTWAAAGTGVMDMVGVIAFAAGAAAGALTIVLVTSAIFPLIAVALSVVFLHERPVANQIAGAFVVVAGLMLLGFAG